MDTGLSLLSVTEMLRVAAKSTSAARRRISRRAALASALGALAMLAFAAVQMRHACSVRAIGLFAFGGRVDGGVWKAASADPEWTFMRARSWAGEWIGGVRADSVARSHMWRAQEVAFLQARGAFLDNGVVSISAARLEKTILPDRPWVAGFEQLSVGWPLRCFRSTVVWGTRAENDRVNRVDTIDGMDTSGDESSVLADIANVQGMMAPVSVIPTGVVWPWLIVNWAVWAVIAFAVVSSFGAVRSIRGAWRIRRGQCRRCGYLLRGIHGSTCPECGFTPSGKLLPRP